MVLVRRQAAELVESGPLRWWRRDCPFTSESVKCVHLAGRRSPVKMHDQDFANLSDRYIRFAEEEARDRSPSYAALARGVAEDREVLGFLMTLPRGKQQPNLLLAAVRHLFGILSDWQ